MAYFASIPAPSAIPRTTAQRVDPPRTAPPGPAPPGPAPPIRSFSQARRASVQKNSSGTSRVVVSANRIRKQRLREAVTLLRGSPMLAARAPAWLLRSPGKRGIGMVLRAGAGIGRSYAENPDDAGRFGAYCNRGGR